MLQGIKVRYDPKFDMLYVKWDSTKGCYGDDSNPGLIYTRDSKSGVIKGVTLVHFVRRYREHRLQQLFRMFCIFFYGIPVSERRIIMGIDKRLVKLWKGNREDVVTTFKMLRQLDIVKEDDAAFLMEKLDSITSAKKAQSDRH